MEMPIYEYQCEACGAISEYLVGVGDDEDMQCKLEDKRMSKVSIVIALLIWSLFLPLLSAMAEKEGQSSYDHTKDLKGPYPDGISVTGDCLKCHKDKGAEILQSAHWLWKGPSPFVDGHEDRTDLGKGTF